MYIYISIMGRQARVYRNLAEFLRLSGKTQGDVAVAAGVSQAAISRYLLSQGGRGRRDMRLSVALRIAEYCRIPIESLVSADAPKRRRPVAPRAHQEEVA
jgi:predicted transcriptional regulator